MKSNKPVLESIAWDRPKQSVLAFATEGQAFEPYWHYHPEIALICGIAWEGKHEIEITLI